MVTRNDIRAHVQAEILARIRDVLRRVEDSGHVVALRAPTGLGKTKIILDLAEELDDYDFVVFVRTRSELSAWVKNSLKFHNKLPSITLAKGQACTVTVAETADALPCHRCRLRREIEEYDYDLVLEAFHKLKTFDPYRVAQYLRKQRVSFCIYSIFKQLGEVSGSRVKVYTYPYLFRTGLHKILLRDLGVDEDEEELNNVIAVCDEAHCIERLFLNPDVRVSIPMLKQVLLELEVLNTKLAEVSDEDLTDTLAVINELVLALQSLITEFSRSMQDEDVVASAKLVDYIEASIAPLDEIAKLLNLLRNIAAKLLAEEVREELAISKLAQFVSMLGHVDDESSVVVYTQQGLEIRNLDLTRLYEDCLSGYRTAILMSGTLQDREYLVRAWGIPRRRLTYLDYSGFRLGKYEVFIVPNLTSLYAVRKRYLDAYASALERIYELAPGVVLAVFPSYAMMRSVYARLPERLKEVTYVETPETKLGEVEEFVRRLASEGQRALVMGVADGRLVEGIELTDEEGRSLISDVVICGYPAPPPTGYTRLLLTRLARSSGLSRDYIVKQWVYIKVRQALGRALRSPSDKARFWLLDVRFRDPEIQELLRLENVQEISLG